MNAVHKRVYILPGEGGKGYVTSPVFLRPSGSKTVRKVEKLFKIPAKTFLTPKSLSVFL